MPAYDTNNIFAKILRGELPCHKVYEDDKSLAFLDIMPGPQDPADSHARATAWVRRFFAFCRADVARYQLLFQPAIPGFHPSPASMRLAGEALAALAQEMAAIGIRRPEASDLWTALVTGLVNQQIANDPDGRQWERLADEAVAMFFGHFEPMEKKPG